MKIENILKTLPQVIENHYNDFPLEELQDLYFTLDSLDHNAESAVEKLEQWLRNHKQSRDILRDFAESYRQVNYSPPLQPVDEAEIIPNLFESKIKLKQVIEKRKKNQK